MIRCREHNYVIKGVSSDIIDAVKKMLKCGTDKLGFTMYQCPSCGQYKKVPFTCHTRICCSCGNLYNMQRANSIAEKMFDVKHRHIVFTIPDALRPYFKNNWSLFDLLFEAAYETIYDAIHQICPKLDVIPGVIAVCHTFSRSSRWNPHVHTIATVGGITKYGKYFQLYGDFIDYAMLRKGFQKRLLKKLQKTLGPSFAPVAVELVKNYPNGFYVHAPKLPAKIAGSVKGLVKYLARYLGRPCVASSRIDGFDGKYVYYHYKRHPDDKLFFEKVLVSTFVHRILQHYPPKNFQMVRYYGIYSNALSSSSRVLTALKTKQVTFLYSRAAHQKRVFYSHWRGAMIRAFHVDPCLCPDCDTEMIPIFSVYKGITYWDVRSSGKPRIIKSQLFPPV